MKAVSVFDSILAAIRESRFNRDEARQIIEELRAVYPEVFEQSGLEANLPADFNERLKGDVNYHGHMLDTRPLVDEDLE
jgi:uncharacterized coiled-coil DUF342 family protein